MLHLKVAIVKQTKLLPWLLARLKNKAFHGNKLYSSEVLSMLLQSSDTNQQALQGEGVAGIDSLLFAAAPYLLVWSPIFSRFSKSGAGLKLELETISDSDFNLVLEQVQTQGPSR